MVWVSVMEIVRPIWNMWINQLQRIGHNQLEGKASEIVVICPVGDIARTEGTEWAGPVSGTID